MLVFSESLVPTVRKALCDPLEEVREAAAKTFEQLHSTIGHQALDDILPALLKQLVRGGPAHNKRDSVFSPMCTDVCLRMCVYGCMALVSRMMKPQQGSPWTV